MRSVRQSTGRSRLCCPAMRLLLVLMILPVSQDTGKHTPLMVCLLEPSTVAQRQAHPTLHTCMHHQWGEKTVDRVEYSLRTCSLPWGAQAAQLMGRAATGQQQPACDPPRSGPDHAHDRPLHASECPGAAQRHTYAPCL